jgi:hypothetical protein
MKYALKLTMLSLLAGVPWAAQAMHLCPGDRVPQLLNMGYPWPIVQQHCSNGTPLPPLQSLQPPPQWPQQPPQGQWPQQPPPLPGTQPPSQPAGGSGITLTRPDGRQISIKSPPCTRAMVMELQQLGMPHQDIQEIIGRMCGGQLHG